MTRLPQLTEQEAIAAVCRLQEKRREAGKEPKAFVLTFGCQQNEADSEKLRGLCDAMGYGVAASPEDADLILVNTCAIREHAELKALSTVGRYKHIKEGNPNLIIGVCGCMTAQAHRVDELKHRYPYVDFTMEPAAMGKLPLLVYAALEKRGRLFLLEETGDALEGLPITRSEKHRAWVSIMYGCNNFCSYCIVPYVRGRERSRESNAIISEVKSVIADGAKDITLLGQNVNSYRSDMDFADLLAALDAMEGEYVLRFMTSHPKDVSPRLLSVLASAKHVEPHFHLPLQSGSDSILKKMNRHYDKAHYLSVVKALRKANPEVVLTSDIIVGFPGETEEDFADTLAMLEEVRFDSVFSFIYSARKGTPAAAMEAQVPSEVQSARFERLLALQGEISREKNEAYLGKTVRVLVDSPSKNGKEGMYSGRTDGGKLVHMQAAASDIGRFLSVRIESATPFALMGTVVPNQ